MQYGCQGERKGLPRLQDSYWLECRRLLGQVQVQLHIQVVNHLNVIKDKQVEGTMHVCIHSRLSCMIWHMHSTFTSTASFCVYLSLCLSLCVCARARVCVREWGGQVGVSGVKGIALQGSQKTEQMQLTETRREHVRTVHYTLRILSLSDPLCSAWGIITQCSVTACI